MQSALFLETARRYKKLYLKSSFETMNFSSCELVFDDIVYIHNLT